ncbi:MAG: tetratricopeptide repeat protein, partial [Acidobacteriota bacterium]
ADLRSRFGRPAGAEPLYRRAVAILDRAGDARIGEHKATLGRLALVVDEQGRMDEAEALYRQAIDIDLQDAGGSTERSIALASSLGNLAALLVRAERPAEAEPLYRRAITLRRAALGPNHWLVAVSRADLAQLLADRGATDEALDLARQAADLLAPYCDGLATTTTMGERRSASMLCRDAQTLLARLERQDPGPAPQPVAVVEPEPTPRPVIARSTTPRFRAQLASRNDLFEAQRTAAMLKARLPGALGDLTAHIETVDLSTKGVWHRVQFGDFDERRGAVELCGLVAATGQECWVVEVREDNP